MFRILLLAAAMLPIVTEAGDLSRKQTKQLRGSITEILIESDSAARDELFEELVLKMEKRDISGVARAMRAGPLLTKKSGEPRVVGGEEEPLESFGSTMMGYSFLYEGARHRYAVDLPASYDFKKPAALLIDPGHGSAKDSDDKTKAGMVEAFRNQLNQAGLRDWIVVRSEIIENIGNEGRLGEVPFDEVGPVVDEFIRDLCSRFAIDVDRIYVSGHSQTGFWTWYLAARHADRFAGIAPSAAVTWQVLSQWDNVSNLATFALHGSEDPMCPVAQAREVCLRLARAGAKVRYLEIEGGKHGASFPELHKAYEWLNEQKRVAYPKRVSKSLSTLQSPWAYWIEITELAKEEATKRQHFPQAGLDAEIEGQLVRIHSEGVKAARLYLSPAMLDLEAEVIVECNGKEVFRGVPERSVRVLLETAIRKADWKGTFEAVIELEIGG